jgi:hypothetical protein
MEKGLIKSQLQHIAGEVPEYLIRRRFQVPSIWREDGDYEQD